jgi:hypothetical protein
MSDSTDGTKYSAITPKSSAEQVARDAAATHVIGAKDKEHAMSQT